MKVEMLMPQMGESIAEAKISRWLKNPGDKIERDEIILEISTDKVDSEIPAPAAGILSEVLFQEGDVVPVKTKIATIDTEATAGNAAATPVKVETSAPSSGVTSPAPSLSTNVMQNGTGQTSGHTTSGHSNSDVESSRYYSPLVRSLAAKHGISLTELDHLVGTGQSGRLTKEDFQKYLNNKQGSAVSSNASAPQATTNEVPARVANNAPQVARPAEPAAKDLPSGSEWSDNQTKIIPMDNMRKAIAEHMVRSKHTSPHVYSVQEIDVTNISKWRKKFKDEFTKNEGFNLSFTPFFLEATVKALLAFPYVNGSVEGNSVVLKKYINLGCAVALANSGLIVPVIKNADEKNLVGIARGLNDLALRARTKKLLPDDVRNGTFTVTNPGVFGTLIGTPIINQPQVAILCLGAIEKRAVVIDDMIAIRERCYLTLSYDHRIIDGSMGGQFLAFIKEYLENWDLNRGLYS